MVVVVVVVVVVVAAVVLEVFTKNSPFIITKEKDRVIIIFILKCITKSLVFDLL